MIEFTLSLAASEVINPAWQSQVDRWYQLDEASKTLCQMIHTWQKQDSRDFKQIQAVIYLFSKGSNEADKAFVKGGLISPAQFVYTLPNVPISVAQQMLGVSMTTYCFNVADVFNLSQSEAFAIEKFLNLFKKRQQQAMVVFQQKNTQKDRWDFKGQWFGNS